MKRTGIRDWSPFSVDVDGVQLHYEKVGSGNQVLLLMPGGIGTSKTDFEYQLENMNRQLFTLIAWNPPGYGISQPPNKTSGYSYDFLRVHAWYAARMMQELEIPKYSLLGWNSGGTTGVLMAANYQDRIQRLITLGSEAYMTEAQLKTFENLANPDNWPIQRKSEFEKVYSRHTICSLAEEWIENYRHYLTFNQGDICCKELGKVKCPTLIIHGEKDELVTPTYAHHLHTNIPHSNPICKDLFRNLKGLVTCHGSH